MARSRCKLILRRGAIMVACADAALHSFLIYELAHEPRERQDTVSHILPSNCCSSISREAGERCIPSNNTAQSAYPAIKHSQLTTKKGGAAARTSAQHFQANVHGANVPATIDGDGPRYAARTSADLHILEQPRKQALPGGILFEAGRPERTYVSQAVCTYAGMRTDILQREGQMRTEHGRSALHSLWAPFSHFGTRQNSTLLVLKERCCQNSSTLQTPRSRW